MRGFEIERALDEDTCSMETLPEKILKVPGIALVAAGTPACLIGLYDSAARINSLDRLFLCQISSVEYSLGKQGKKIWEAVELAANTEGIRGVIIYSSCMEVLTMWDFQREKKKINRQSPKITFLHIRCALCIPGKITEVKCRTCKIGNNQCGTKQHRPGRL